MARVFLTGFDALDRYVDTGTSGAYPTGVTVETTIVHVGGGSLKFIPPSAIATAQIYGSPTQATYYRAYFRFTVLPSSTARRFVGASGTTDLRINPSGTVAVYYNNSLIGTSTAALTDTSKWY